MKRILIVDDSEMIRETLALILGGEFIVFKRSLGTEGLAFAQAEQEIDLLILGVTPALSADPGALLAFAAGAPFAVLFLVDSQSTAQLMGERGQVACLTKPFTPYQVKDKVGRLLAQREILPKAQLPAPGTIDREVECYLDFPYLSRAAATLARRFALTDLPLLITGEIGCGQARVARAIAALRGSELQRITVNDGRFRTEPVRTGAEVAPDRSAREGTGTLLVENVENLSREEQASLLGFLEEQTQAKKWRILGTAQLDLLEKLYQGKFLEELYYRLAILKLQLAPLRDRREDIPGIAVWFAQFYAKALGLGAPSFSPAANERLKNYLWFGNLSEMETVVARTLAAHGKTSIDGPDLVFECYGPSIGLELTESSEAPPPEPRRKEQEFIPAQSVPSEREPTISRLRNGHDQPMDVNELIHELAHELKNPMVTIKTFAQLLVDRYHDENFRARFQDIVGGDIERMDELLEILIEFAEFPQPRATNLSIAERLRSVIEEIGSECAKRQTVIRWTGNGHDREVCTDEEQLHYILKNVLLAVLFQTKMGTEIEVAMDSAGGIVTCYLRDGGRVAHITHYFWPSSASAEEDGLPLRMLLAKQLLERNGGKMAIDHSHGEKDILRMEFPEKREP